MASRYRVLELTVDRERARFGAWYEFFPRSTGTATEHGTFATASRRLPEIAEMGFDIVYLPPIHPIGTTHRKGRNNALQADPDDVGSPWAIGGKAGGHKSVHPQLGTIDDFDAFVAAARKLGLEVALDYAIQCSPDHPWVVEHPEWFHHRPDGTIKFAENPPKKYQDIYPVNFDTEAKEELWQELKSVIDYWISHGISAFRVDNPHTKPVVFWEWLIQSVHEEHPEVIFLAEAFTPSVATQRALAKAGFTQSYTYFTWANTKPEIVAMMNELTEDDVPAYLRPNFFVNTPDILHEYLQKGGPPAFKIRLVLAATLSPTYGVYSGYELFEHTPVREGSEEYLDSEKYELKPRDFSIEGSLVDLITRINELRRKHQALSQWNNVRWHDVDNDDVLAFSKVAPEGDSLLVVVDLDPFKAQEAVVSLDLDALGVAAQSSFEAHELLTGTSERLQGEVLHVRLDPAGEPARIYRVEG